MSLHPTIAAVTDRIIERSKPTRRRYLELMTEQKERGIDRPRLRAALALEAVGIELRVEDRLGALPGAQAAALATPC